MRRVYLTVAFLCMCLAIFFALYGYYILIRSPGTEIGVMGFFEKLVYKLGYLLFR